MARTDAYTRAEVENELLEMGLDRLGLLNPQAVEYLMRAINETMKQDQNDDTGALFSDLTVDPVDRVHDKSVSDDELCSKSPIVPRHRSRRRSKDAGAIPPKQRVQEDTNDHSVDVELINSANEHIRRMYRVCDYLSDVSAHVRKTYLSDDASASSGNGRVEATEREVLRRLQPDAARGRIDDRQRSFPTQLGDSRRQPPVRFSLSDDDEPDEVVNGPPAMDPSIRKVLNPPPGRLPFRHDPVTKFNLYMEEWKHHPAPGEQKRLSLRWRIREYMLRRDMPRCDAENFSQPLLHPKEWSPRPYMD